MEPEYRDFPPVEPQEQGYYLDGSPASNLDVSERPSIIGQTVAQAANYLNPFNWFKKHPSRRPPPYARPPPRREQPPLRSTIVIPRPVPADAAEQPNKRRRHYEIEFGKGRRDEYRENPSKNGMPPNVDLVEDERPPGIPVASYLTDDEDSDVEFLSSSSPMASRRKKLAEGSKTAGFSRDISDSDRQPSTSELTRSPLSERKDLSSPLSSPPSRRNVGLPSVLTPPRSSAAATNMQHPLMEHTKAKLASGSPGAPGTPASSKKRGFQEVDKDEALPSFFSEFPRSSDRRTTGVLPVSRFGPRLSEVQASTSKVGDTTRSNLGKRYLGNSGAGIPLSSLGTDSARSSPSISDKEKIFPAMKRMPLPYGRASPPVQTDKLPSRNRLKLENLEYKYIVPSPILLPADGQEFVFNSSFIVPSGTLAQTIDVSGFATEPSSRTSPVPKIYRCRICGISVKNGEQECSECAGVRRSQDRDYQSGESLRAAPNADKISSQKKSDQTVNQPEAPGWTCKNCKKDYSERTERCVECGARKSDARTVGKAPSSVKSSGSTETRESTTSFGFKDAVGDKPKPAQSGKETGFTYEKQTEPSIRSAPETIATTSTAPLSTGFNDIWAKKKSGWDCQECFVGNKDDQTTCAACGSARPGAAPSATAAPVPSFSFGAAPLNFQFGATPAGKPTESVSSSTAPQLTGGFSFGATSAAATSAAPVSTGIFGAPPTASLSFNFGAPVSTQSSTTPSMGFGFAPVSPVTNGLPVSEAVKVDSTPVVSSTAARFEVPKPSSAGSVFGGFNVGAAAVPTDTTKSTFNLAPASVSSDSSKPAFSFGAMNHAPTSGSLFGSLANGLPATSTTVSTGFSGFGTEASKPVVTVSSGNPQSSFMFGQTNPVASNSFAGFSSTAPSSGFGAAPSTFAPVPTSSASTLGFGSNFFSQGKTDASTPTFSFGMLNGQTGGGLQASQPTMGGMTASQPNAQVLSLLGQQAAMPAQPGTFGAMTAPPNGRRVVKAKRNITQR